MKNILLVDDSIDIQEIITFFFKEHSDYKISIADDGEKALDMVESDPPDFILLDVVLPKMNGIAFLSELRRIENAENIPIIMMSGEMVDEAISEEGKSLGIIEFFEKPLHLPDLLERVKKHFDEE